MCVLSHCSHYIFNIFHHIVNFSDVGCGFSPSLDMLQLISNQEMEFGGLFDNPPYTAPPPTQELTGLNQSNTSTPATMNTTPPKTSPPSILSSSPHLDALLGPPITRSSSTPDKAFQPPTFQQSPLAQLSSSTQRQQPASTQQAQSVRPPIVEQPPANLTASAPAQAGSSHGSPGPNPAFSPVPQNLFTLPAAQTPPQSQLQGQIQTQAQTSYTNQNSCTGKHILMMNRGHFKCLFG